MSYLKCPKCNRSDIGLLSTDNNMKVKHVTSLTLNPIKPFKTKTIKKEKTSLAKVGLGLATGGMSLLVTGTKEKRHNEYFCRDCGHRWIGK